MLAAAGRSERHQRGAGVSKRLRALVRERSAQHLDANTIDVADGVQPSVRCGHVVVGGRGPGAVYDAHVRDLSGNRAGVPDGWAVGDKTGTGATYGARNDIAVVWPPNAAPLVVAGARDVTVPLAAVLAGAVDLLVSLPLLAAAMLAAPSAGIAR